MQASLATRLMLLHLFTPTPGPHDPCTTAPQCYSTTKHDIYFDYCTLQVHTDTRLLYLLYASVDHMHLIMHNSSALLHFYPCTATPLHSSTLAPLHLLPLHASNLDSCILVRARWLMQLASQYLLLVLVSLDHLPDLVFFRRVIY